MAARYLCHALKLDLAGGNLYNLARIWHSYMDVIEQESKCSDTVLTIEWTNVNDCFDNIALAGKSVIVFLPRTRLVNFAFTLIR